ACGDDGLPTFDRLRYRRADASVFLFAFDLLELDGRDLRREPLEVRKATLAPCCGRLGPACSSMSTFSMRTAMSCFATLARWGWRGWCRSGSARGAGPIG